MLGRICINRHAIIALLSANNRRHFFKYIYFKIAKKKNIKTLTFKIFLYFFFMLKKNKKKYINGYIFLKKILEIKKRVIK